VKVPFSNTRAVPATLQRVTVVDASRRDRVIARFEGADLEGRLRSLSNAPGGTRRELDSLRQLLVDLRFDDEASIPASLAHRFDLLAASVNATSLRGTGRVAYNGRCSAGGAHRATGPSVNGSVHFAQRFAFDWIRMDAQGFTVRGDERDAPALFPDPRPREKQFPLDLTIIDF
jgi:hypothetical protein